MQETWVQSQGQEDLLQEEMATRSSVLAWGIPRTGEPGRPPSMGSRALDTTEPCTYAVLSPPNINFVIVLISDDD